jgi:ribosomal-protein-alanine N-acetyltransferase
MIVEDIFCELPELETDRLVMRMLSLDDAKDIFDYTSDPEFAKYLSWGPATSIDDSISFLSDAMFRYQLGDVAGWGLVNKRDDKLIGTCGFTNWDPESKKAEIGYALAREYWGQGYITEAVKRAVRYGFESMELNRIEAMCDAQNVGSARVMEKAGMSFEGLLRHYGFWKGEYHDIKLYSILRGEFSELRS